MVASRVKTWLSPNSIIGRLNRTIAVSMVSLLLATTLAISFVQVNTRLSERDQIVTSLGHAFEKVVARPISQGDFILAETYIQINDAPEFIRSIRLLDSNKEVVARFERPDNSTCVASMKKSFPIGSPTVHVASSEDGSSDPSRIGYVEIAYSGCGIWTSNLIQVSLPIAASIAFVIVAFICAFSGLKRKLNDLQELARLRPSEAEFQARWAERAPIELIPLFKEVSNLYSSLAEARMSAELVEVARGVAHDIRSPLGALKVFAAKVSDLTDEQRRFLDQIIGRINAVAEDLLAKSRNRALLAEQRVDITEVDISSIMNQVIAEKRLELSGSGGPEIHLRCEGSLKVLASKDNLARIISNLLNNAVEAMSGRKSGEIIATVKSVKDEALISIQDAGRGMTKEQIDLVLSRPISFGKTKGSGIGIASARKKIMEWGGKFEMTSTPGQGTTVRVRLPITRLGHHLDIRRLQ